MQYPSYFNDLLPETGVYGRQPSDQPLMRGRTRGVSPYRMQPQIEPEGFSNQERIFNLARNQMAVANRMEEEAAKEALATRGFFEGESGIASGLMGTLRRGASQRLGEYATQLGISEEEKSYGREQQALQSLFNMLGLQQTSQATAWTPYWSSLVGIYGG